MDTTLRGAEALIGGGIVSVRDVVYIVELLGLTYNAAYCYNIFGSMGWLAHATRLRSLVSRPYSSGTILYYARSKPYTDSLSGSDELPVE